MNKIYLKTFREWMFSFPSDWLLVDNIIFPVSIVAKVIIETGICKNSVRPDRRFSCFFREILR